MVTKEQASKDARWEEMGEDGKEKERMEREREKRKE